MRKLIVAILLLLAAIGAMADEKRMPTDVGEVVLSSEPCTLTFQQPGNGLDWHAYATEAGAPVHTGCWRREGPLVYIYFPEIEALATYSQVWFK